MAKKVYIGVGGKARKVKKMYIGVSGKARKVKKGYIGVGGKARPFFTGGEVTYYGTITNLSAETAHPQGASSPTHALFSHDRSTNVVDAYNTSLTRSTPTALSVSIHSDRTSASIGEYALFAGGQTGAGSSSGVNNVDAYNASLTRSTPTALTTKVSGAIGGNNSKYAIIGGGWINGESTSSSALTYKVDMYDSSLTKTALSKNTFGRRYLGAAVGNSSHVIFAGGSEADGDTIKTAVAIDTSGTITALESLRSGRKGLDGGMAGSYFVFGGGYDGVSSSDAMQRHADAYDSSLTKVTTVTTVGNTVMSSGLPYEPCPAVQVGENVVFYVPGDRKCFAFDPSLVQTSLQGLTLSGNPPQYYGTATVGNYGLFAGGLRHADVVDAYVV